MDAHSSSAQPLVSVGIPCYNRAHGLRQALGSICKQTYRNLEIIVSDNDSPDPEVGAVIEEFKSADSRIIAHKMETNLGWLKNFCYVFEAATSKDYFMWACDDDIWEPTFIETGIKALQEQPHYDAWCCTVDNIDKLGRCIRSYMGFSRFTSTDNKRQDLIRYLREPEGMGKANVYYSIYRMDRIQGMMREFCFTHAWGSDMAFNLGFLARNSLIAVDDVLLHKGVTRTAVQDEADEPVLIDGNRMNRRMFSPKRSVEYIRECYLATCTTPYKNLVLWVMILRVPHSCGQYFVRRCKAMTRSLQKRMRRLRACTDG